MATPSNIRGIIHHWIPDPVMNQLGIHACHARLLDVAQVCVFLIAHAISLQKKVLPSFAKIGS